MDHEQFQRIAKTVADPSRMAVLELIAAQTECVACSSIREKLQVTPATVSHHMSELQTAGLVHARREAKHVYYTLNRTVWDEFLSELQARVPTLKTQTA